MAAAAPVDTPANASAAEEAALDEAAMGVAAVDGPVGSATTACAMDVEAAGATAEGGEEAAPSETMADVHEAREDAREPLVEPPQATASDPAADAGAAPGSTE